MPRVVTITTVFLKAKLVLTVLLQAQLPPLLSLLILVFPVFILVLHVACHRKGITQTGDGGEGGG